MLVGNRAVEFDCAHILVETERYSLVLCLDPPSGTHDVVGRDQEDGGVGDEVGVNDGGCTRCVTLLGRQTVEPSGGDEGECRYGDPVLML